MLGYVTVALWISDSNVSHITVALVALGYNIVDFWIN